MSPRSYFMTRCWVAPGWWRSLKAKKSSPMFFLPLRSGHKETAVTIRAATVACAVTATSLHTRVQTGCGRWKSLTLCGIRVSCHETCAWGQILRCIWVLPPNWSGGTVREIAEGTASGRGCGIDRLVRDGGCLNVIHDDPGAHGLSAVSVLVKNGLDEAQVPCQRAGISSSAEWNRAFHTQAAKRKRSLLRCVPVSATL